MINKNLFYVYVYLDNRKPGAWNYLNYEFNYQPFYVGRGKKRRINQHMAAGYMSNNSIKSNTINAIIRETGHEPIRYKIAENLTFEEANELECNIIKYFGRIDNTTGILANCTDGGEGFKNIIFSAETRAKMSEKAKGSKTYANNGHSKKVAQYDLLGKYINEYDSLITAQDATGISFSNISSCMRGKSKHAGGFTWKCLGKSYQPVIKAQAIDKRKPVYQYTLDGIFIKLWESASNAVETLNIGHIHQAAAGKYTNIGGFQWFYEDKGLKTTSVIHCKLSFTRIAPRAENIEVFDYLTQIKHQFKTRRDAAKFYDISTASILNYIKSGEIFTKYIR